MGENIETVNGPPSSREGDRELKILFNLSILRFQPMIKESESFGEISAKILDFSQLDSETGEEFQPTNIYLLIHDSISIKCLT